MLSDSKPIDLKSQLERILRREANEMTQEDKQKLAEAERIEAEKLEKVR